MDWISVRFGISFVLLIGRWRRTARKRLPYSWESAGRASRKERLSEETLQFFRTDGRNPDHNPAVNREF
jgi:hypothetical protein